MAGQTLQCANQLVDALPALERDALAAHLEHVDLVPHSTLTEPGKPLVYAYFPHASVACLMAEMQRGIAATATVGPEGMIGFETLLGARVATQWVRVQVGGSASRLPIETLGMLARAHPRLNHLLLGYVRYLFAQVLQSVACNARHTLMERCARWLLMTQDRAGTPKFALTQELLAEMLGSHRPSVTMVARDMQAAGLISYSRGMIKITDRPGLERASCECYRTVRTALEEILFRPPRED
ncbi:MAG: Crp/Fnr family transcriptional regulator [Rhodospirillales bacterium]|jgi:CRP-like cAMP-binding protein|nr:Crp/Fnr family transcriptional regulator [Rhodospirillales bacterium]